MNEKKRVEMIKRYIILFVGLFFSSLGVGFVTKADLGTSPISSIPYVLNLNFSFTLGQFTILFSVFLIVLQIIILRRNFEVHQLFQIPTSIFFGYFIDISMNLLGFVFPVSYISKIAYLIIGCIILGIGVWLEILADLVMLPGESFVRAVVSQWKTEFGITKICFDVSMSVSALILSFVLVGELNGVREGTIIAAFLVGYIARQIGKNLSFLQQKIYEQ